MTAMNYTTARSLTVIPTYLASEELMSILFRHRFVEVSGICGQHMHRFQGFLPGRNYYFRRHGQCTINFLKDGRIHVLYSPIALWNLHDALTRDELGILIAFATLGEEHQELMRNFMGPRCCKYTDVLRQLPPFEVDWKQEFLQAYGDLQRSELEF